MANYRCYCLDRHGCIRAVTAIAADTDDRARASAVVLLTTCAHAISFTVHPARSIGFEPIFFTVISSFFVLDLLFLIL